MTCSIDTRIRCYRADSLCQSPCHIHHEQPHRPSRNRQSPPSTSRPRLSPLFHHHHLILRPRLLPLLYRSILSQRPPNPRLGNPKRSVRDLQLSLYPAMGVHDVSFLLAHLRFVAFLQTPMARISVQVQVRFTRWALTPDYQLLTIIIVCSSCSTRTKASKQTVYDKVLDIGKSDPEAIYLDAGCFSEHCLGTSIRTLIG
jgi:hypothetical protein